jgi:hypothetical protein
VSLGCELVMTACAPVVLLSVSSRVFKYSPSDWLPYRQSAANSRYRHHTGMGQPSSRRAPNYRPAAHCAAAGSGKGAASAKCPLPLAFKATGDPTGGHWGGSADIRIVARTRSRSDVIIVFSASFSGLPMTSGRGSAALQRTLLPGRSSSILARGSPHCQALQGHNL